MGSLAAAAASETAEVVAVVVIAQSMGWAGSGTVVAGHSLPRQVAVEISVVAADGLGSGSQVVRRHAQAQTERVGPAAVRCVEDNSVIRQYILQKYTSHNTHVYDNTRRLLLQPCC